MSVLAVWDPRLGAYPDIRERSFFDFAFGASQMARLISDDPYPAAQLFFEESWIGNIEGSSPTSALLKVKPDNSMRPLYINDGQS